MEHRYDKDKLGLQLPEAFDNLKGKKLDFEMVKSNSLQPINLIFESNIVTRSIAYIFVNSECNGLDYRNARGKGEMVYELFKDILLFKEVTIYNDQTMAEVIQKLKHLQQKAAEFE